LLCRIPPLLEFETSKIFLGGGPQQAGFSNLKTNIRISSI
jgi:hypothetical protein